MFEWLLMSSLAFGWKPGFIRSRPTALRLDPLPRQALNVALFEFFGAADDLDVVNPVGFDFKAVPEKGREVRPLRFGELGGFFADFSDHRHDRGVACHRD